jgi:hypothetical protein
MGIPGNAEADLIAGLPGLTGELGAPGMRASACGKCGKRDGIGFGIG